jgi:hypothetical protein
MGSRVAARYPDDGPSGDLTAPICSAAMIRRSTDEVFDFVTTPANCAHTEDVIAAGPGFAAASAFAFSA